MSSFFAEMHVAAAIFIAALDNFFFDMPPCRSHLPMCSVASTPAFLK